MTRIDQSIREQLSLYLPKERLQELLRRQLVSLEKSIQNIELGCVNNDMQLVASAAHQLTGAADMAGFCALADVARPLDKPHELQLKDATIQLELLRDEWIATRHEAHETSL